MAAASLGERLNGAARPTMLSNLTAAYELIARAGLTHERPPLRHRERHRRQRGGGGDGGGGRRHALRHAAAFQEGRHPGAAARAGGGAAVGPFRDAAARHRAHHAGRARRLHHRLAQRPRRAARSRRLRLRRLHRASDPLARDDRAGRPHGGGVPALRRRAGGGERDGAGRQSGAAALAHADGGADRHPRQPDQGQ